MVTFVAYLTCIAAVAVAVILWGAERPDGDEAE